MAIDQMRSIAVLFAVYRKCFYGEPLLPECERMPEIIPRYN